MKKPQFFIGIDPGVNTGVAIWNTEYQKFTGVSTMDILTAVFTLQQFINETGAHNFFFIIEDARLRKHDKGLTPEKAQGAGSVKRDSSIWQAFCERFHVQYKLCAPSGKLNALAQNAELFKKNTGVEHRTSEHARCAAMLVWKS